MRLGLEGSRLNYEDYVDPPVTVRQEKEKMVAVAVTLTLVLAYQSDSH